MTNLIKAADKNIRLKQKVVGVVLLFMAAGVALYGFVSYEQEPTQQVEVLSVKDLNKTEQQKHDNAVKRFTSTDYGKPMPPMEFDNKGNVTN